jgi:aminobenzoyl-glutamate utilization protein B
MPNKKILVTSFLALWMFFGMDLQTFAQEDSIPVEPAKLTPAKKTATEWIDSNRDRLASWSDQIWDFAELALQEFKSSTLLAEELERAGFNVTRGVSDMPTAFVAEYGSGEPLIGILAEYDALPTLSQKATSQREPAREGAAGHGCGHNLFGAGSVGAALALKQAMEREKITGTIRLYGSPAEENYSGKTYMARDGWFDALDAALHWHPGSKNVVSLRSSNAMNGVEIEFFGQTAHAAGSPWSGRSALDAVELLDIGMNYLREHVNLTARIHYVITAGGGAANVVPDHASVWYMIRDKDRQGVDYLHVRLLDSAKGASLMTRTTHKVHILEGVWNMLTNEAGSKLMHSNLLMVGPPAFTEEEQLFAKAIQKELGIEEEGLSSEIDPLRHPETFTGSGSTDVSDVSWITPTIGLGVAVSPIGSPGHHWSTVACGGRSIGHKTLVVAAKTLASTALDLLQNPDLLQEIRAEWKESTKGIQYKSAIPDGQKPPQFQAPVPRN